MEEKELIDQLIEAFRIKRDFWLDLGYAEKAMGIEDCMNHLYSYQALKEDE